MQLNFVQIFVVENSWIVRNKNKGMKHIHQQPQEMHLECLGACPKTERGSIGSHAASPSSCYSTLPQYVFNGNSTQPLAVASGRKESSVGLCLLQMDSAHIGSVVVRHSTMCHETRHCVDRSRPKLDSGYLHHHLPPFNKLNNIWIDCSLLHDTSCQKAT